MKRWPAPWGTLQPAIPERPSWLDAEARAAWDAVVPKLHACRLLTTVDGLALAMLCSVYAAYQRHRHEARAAAELRMEARAWAAEFLLIPADRVRAGLVDDEGDVELREIFSGTRPSAVRCRPRRRRVMAQWGKPGSVNPKPAGGATPVNPPGQSGPVPPVGAPGTQIPTWTPPAKRGRQ